MKRKAINQHKNTETIHVYNHYHQQRDQSRESSVKNVYLHMNVCREKQQEEQRNEHRKNTHFSCFIHSGVCIVCRTCTKNKVKEHQGTTVIFGCHPIVSFEFVVE